MGSCGKHLDGGGGGREYWKWWKELHSEELHGLHVTPSGSRMNKSRRLSRAGAVTNTQERKIRTSYLWRNPKEGCKLEDPGLDGSVL
jgi:hypothetical protein